MKMRCSGTVTSNHATVWWKERGRLFFEPAEEDRVQEMFEAWKETDSVFFAGLKKWFFIATF